MSLNPQPGYTVPAETGFVAKAIFPKGNLCITMADCLDSFVSDQDFSILFSKQGQPGVSPMRLALATRSDLRWQSRAGKGFAASDFKVDWLQQVAICPEGKTSTSWTPAIDGRDNEVIKIKFARSDCATCPSLHLCTRTKEKRRLVTLRKEAQYKALQAARKQAMTDEYKADYARRAGIEATLSESIRAHGLRHARYIGLAKTHLQPTFDDSNSN